jgi:hypothetical protein
MAARNENFSYRARTVTELASNKENGGCRLAQLEVK